MAKEIFILGGRRTPMTEYVGALKDVKDIDLGAAAARDALESSGITATELDHELAPVVGEPLTWELSSEEVYDLYTACGGVSEPPDVRPVRPDEEADAHQALAQRLRQCFINLKKRRPGSDAPVPPGAKGGREPVVPDEKGHQKYIEWGRRKEKILFFIGLSLFCSWFIVALFILLRDPQMSLRAAVASALFWMLIKLFPWMIQPK